MASRYCCATMSAKTAPGLDSHFRERAVTETRSAPRSPLRLSGERSRVGSRAVAAILRHTTGVCSSGWGRVRSRSMWISGGLAESFSTCRVYSHVNTTVSLNPLPQSPRRNPKTESLLRSRFWSGCDDYLTGTLPDFLGVVRLLGMVRL